MISISIPFRFENGKVASTSNNAVIAKQRIADVLATDRFERVNRPEYGANIKSLLFEPLDPLVFADYRMDAVKDLNDYVSNAKIVDLQVKQGGASYINTNDDTTLGVKVIYRTSEGNTATYVANINQTTILTEESTI